MESVGWVMRILIMSDIHGNEEALKAVLEYVKLYSDIQRIILLGDIIDYGVHSNEVVDILKYLDKTIICNIWGNHEEAVLNDNYTRFSSERGKKCAQFTRSVLTSNSWNYIRSEMSHSGMMEFILEGKKCLAVHGSLEDMYWKSIRPGVMYSEYQKYDYVFSGHSHLPHMFEVFYEIYDPENRNRKKTVFINPGSVGQPRNLNPMAQFVVWETDTDEIEMKKIPYDIEKEQEAYTDQVDDFYRKRLERGI